MEKNKVVLDFCIFDFEDITHDSITDLLNIQPVKIHVKGAKRNSNNPNSPLIKQNSWRMNADLDEYASFEEQMNSILDMMESKLEVFKLLCENYYTEFSCAIFTYSNNGESTPWVHLDKRYNKLSVELGFEFDIDLYAW